GGQAKPEIWPTDGAHPVTGALEERPIEAMRCRTTPWTRLKSPPANSLPLGPTRTTNTLAFAPGFHAATAPVVALNAATLLRLTPPDAAPGARTALNCPPTYITFPENVIARTVPLVCQEGLGGKGLAARAWPELPSSINPAHAAPRKSRRRMPTRYPLSRTAQR